jgi:hypothetical protein
MEDNLRPFHFLAVIGICGAIRHPGPAICWLLHDPWYDIPVDGVHDPWKKFF